MKNIIINADGDRMLYFVPDAVADNLKEYCYKFIKWMENDPKAVKYRVPHKGGYALCYDESDFIEYLNTECFPKEQSSLVKSLGAFDMTIPKEYEKVPKFNF